MRQEVAVKGTDSFVTPSLSLSLYCWKNVVLMWRFCPWPDRSNVEAN